MARLKVRLPKQIGNDAVKHFCNSFRLGGFEDQGVEMWALPKRKQGGKGFTRADRTRATLVQSGALRNSVHVISTSPGVVVIGTDLPYTKIHNDGLKMGRGGGNMPKRQFKGNSRKLNAQLKKKISFEVLKALKV